MDSQQKNGRSEEDSVELPELKGKKKQKAPSDNLKQYNMCD